MRLDKYLQEKNNLTREKAQEFIKSGSVKVNNKTCSKPSRDISNHDNVELLSKQEYVSRGAYKLKHACETFKISPKNRVVLDIGASTGGFSDYCLKNGASRVFAVDVGTDQLDKTLKKNSRLTSIEQTNIKDLELQQISEDVDLIVADVSFISLTHVIKKISSLFKKRIEMLLLIKPQFELTKEYIIKTKGLVISENKRHEALERVANCAKKFDYEVIGIVDSPIKGKKMGNQEYIIYLK